MKDLIDFVGFIALVVTLSAVVMGGNWLMNWLSEKLERD